LFGKQRTFHPLAGISSAPGQNGQSLSEAAGRSFLATDTMIHSLIVGSHRNSI
jgi:hypothetical protein